MTLFGSANMHGIGRNEELLGRVVRNECERLVIATKFGACAALTGPFSESMAAPTMSARRARASLRRLSLEVIDLSCRHRVDPMASIEVSVGAMAELMGFGKVRDIGLSEASSGSIRRAYAVHPITALQREYSRWGRDPAPELGRGFLTGREDLKSDDFRRQAPRIQGENFSRHLRLVDHVKQRA